jgi:hypothetical protein
MIDKLKNLLLNVNIVTNTHYELGNKLMKRFKQKKQIVFYTFVTKSHRQKKKKLFKNFQMILISNLLCFQKNMKPRTININIFVFE